MQIKTFQFNNFIENTYIVWDKTNECIIIDAGNNNDQENQTIKKFIEDHKLKPVALLNTHCHIDHILGIVFLQKTYNIDFCANLKDNYLIDNASNSARMFGLKFNEAPKINKNIGEGDVVKFGSSELKVLEVPGHSLGHLAFYNETGKFIFTGDLLFKDTIGRTDLPGGDLDKLLNSIKTKIFTLEDNYTVLAGHGVPTSVGYEKMNNPFF